MENKSVQRYQGEEEPQLNIESKTAMRSPPTFAIDGVCVPSAERTHTPSISIVNNLNQGRLELKIIPSSHCRKMDNNSNQRRWFLEA